MARKRATDLDGIVELAASDPAAAIVRLVAAWRKSHDAGVGAAIEVLAPRTIQPIEALPSKQKERAAALVRAAETATDATLSSALAEVEPFVRSASGAISLPVVDALLARVHDPRIAYCANRLFADASVSSTSKLERRLLACIERHGDAGVLGQLAARAEEGRGRWGAFDAARLARVKSRLESRAKGPPVAEAAIRALCERQGAPATSVSPEALMADILAALDDDGPRQVYADYLLEQGDPRGEWINLQLSGTRASKARRDELFAKHRAELLGPFRHCVKLAGLGFSRGFLSRATAGKRWPASPQNAFLEALDLDRQLFEPTCELPRLESARQPDPSQLGLLFERAPRLVELGTYVDSDSIAQLRAIPARPMRRLELEAPPQPALLHAALSAPIARDAKAIQLRCYRSVELALAGLLAAVPLACQRFTYVTVIMAMRFDFTRTAQGWTLAAEVGSVIDTYRPRVVEQLTALIEGLQVAASTFEISSGPDVWLAARVGEIAREHGLAP